MARKLSEPKQGPEAKKEVIVPSAAAYFVADRVIKHYDRVMQAGRVNPHEHRIQFNLTPRRAGVLLSVVVTFDLEEAYRQPFNRPSGMITVGVSSFRPSFSITHETFQLNIPRNLTNRLRRERVAILYQRASDQDRLYRVLENIFAAYRNCKLSSPESAALVDFGKTYGHHTLNFASMNYEDALFWRPIFKALLEAKMEAERIYQAELKKALEREREALRKAAKSYVYVYKGGNYVLKEEGESTSGTSGGDAGDAGNAGLEFTKQGHPTPTTFNVAEFIDSIRDRISAQYKSPEYTVEGIGAKLPAVNPGENGAENSGGLGGRVAAGVGAAEAGEVGEMGGAREAIRPRVQHPDIQPRVQLEPDGGQPLFEDFDDDIFGQN